MIFKNISFIGAGKVGTSLAKYFKENNYNIAGFYSKSQASLKNTCDFLNISPFNSLDELVKNSDFIFITTPDDCIKHVWEQLKNCGNLEKKYICHTSGSLSSKIFSNINSFGAYEFSIHPMWAFSDKYNSYKNLKNSYFSIEGNEEKLPIIKKFINSLGNNSFTITSKNKSLYHSASVTVSNFLLSLIELGTNYLVMCGVSKEDAEKALKPLILNNINNFKKQGILNSITGPIERNDIGTIDSHLKIIPREHIELYKILSLNLLQLSKIKNPHKNYEDLQTLLLGDK
ncbi:Rossmann-like and DUF2520 domain-containing protein [Hathewaya limosa]|uniref:Short-subunit dehydrogenase-like oxidoreductase (DUF2520 family) n=1 Tax=Hathewaya limosa TaxID=1536 RepID=A0ABU0JN39_HATLI|nr:Rossmann-like and DUF2520 domain-containing protein [Hathewaya limosa]MDQ0478490.1 putative short-subunit dehydrogenase-like oxidoreductase (DUF2520 family) [Hathewaya limosa]